MAPKKAYIGITIGDAGGIGPEVVGKALRSPACVKGIIPILIGKKDIWEKYGPFPKRTVFIDLPGLSNKAIPSGRPSAFAGELAYRSVVKGFELAMIGSIGSLVTAPAAKESFALAGHKYPGHTELLASLCNVSSYAMLMKSAELFVLLATRHLALKDVSKHLSARSIVEQSVLCAKFIKRVIGHRPVIRIAGLNPHAGEHGIIGTEEQKIIGPAISGLKKLKFIVAGPVPSDYVFYGARSLKDQLIVCQYHDQAMIPLKLLGPEKIVNITVGLPFIRTSPGHGTAFDIAGRAQADPRSMIEAINTAVKYSGK